LVVVGVSAERASNGLPVDQIVGWEFTRRMGNESSATYFLSAGGLLGTSFSEAICNLRYMWIRSLLNL
jgi:hypothetical protein